MSTKEKTKSNDWMSLILKDAKAKVAIDYRPPERIRIGSPSLNWALGGGLYRGYTACFYGPEGGGKSLITMLGVAAVQKADPEAMAVLISPEMRPMAPDRLRTLGVDPNRLIIRMVNTLHDVFDWIESKDEKFEHSDGQKGMPGLQWLLMNGAPIQALVVDSIKGIQGPREQKSESSEDEIQGDLSRFLNPALRRALPIIRENNLATMFVQQVNMERDADRAKYISKWSIPTGQSLKHFCEHMCLVERVESKAANLYSEEKTGVREKVPLQEGHTIRVKVDKANLDAPFRQAEFKIHYQKGIVETGVEIAKLAEGLGVIRHPEKDGKPIAAQYAFGEKKWIGFDKMAEAIEADAAIQEEILTAVYQVTDGKNGTSH